MIRWIVAEKLGTAASIDFRPDQRTVQIDARSLVDKGGNAPQALLEKVGEGVAALETGHPVVVVCDFGVSRSNTIAAGILMRLHNLDVDSAVAEVVRTTGETSIKLEMIESLRQAFGDQSAIRNNDHVLITGARGFLGSALAHQLASRNHVFAPGRAELDLLGPASALDRYCRTHHIGKIVHLAYPRVYTNNDAMGESLRMLRNVLDVCKLHRIHLILPSSWVVFSGYRTAFMDADVTINPRPRGVYGETKFLEEVLINNAVANRELCATIVRLSPVYGANSLRPRLIRFARQYLLEDKPIVTHRYRNGLPRLQLLYVDDAVVGLASVVNSGRSGIYHLGGATAYEPREIVAMIAASVGRAAKIEETLIDDYAANVVLDFELAERELGWRPHVDLAVGLDRMFDNS